MLKSKLSQLLKHWILCMTNYDYFEASRRRAIFLKLMKEEGIKCSTGKKYSKGLLAACEMYLSETPKPRIKVYSNGNRNSCSRFIDEDFIGI